MIETLTYGQIKKNLYTFELLKKIIIIIAVVQLVIFHELEKHYGLNALTYPLFISTLVLFLCTFIIEAYVRELLKLH